MNNIVENANEAYENGEYVLALLLFEEWQAKRSGRDDASDSFLAICYQKCGQFDKCVELLAELEENADTTDDEYFFWLYYGRCMKGFGHREKAEQAFRRITEIRPTCTTGYIFLSGTLMQSDPDAAEKVLKRALNRNAQGDLEEVYLNLAWIKIAKSAYTEAMSYLDSALEIDGDYAACHKLKKQLIKIADILK